MGGYFNNFFGYDVLGRRTSATVKNAGGNVLHEDGWSYDILGRMSRQQSTTGTLDYAWDAGGNLSGVKSITPGGYDLSYDYDALGRLATVYEGQEGIDPASRPIAAYGYDANGNLAGVGYANGIQHAYAYDALNRLTGLNVARQAVGNGTPATPVQGYAYTLDPAGRRTGIAELGGRTIANTFDALGRLTRETIGGATSSPTGTLAYAYDAVGNRLSRNTTGGLTALLPNQAKAFTANDQLTSDSYDGNGNTTSSLITDHGSLGTSSATDVYSFDNRLIRRTRGDGVVIDLTYNADGDRMSKRVTENGLTRDVRLYLVDRANPTGYAQVVEEKDHTGQLIARNLYGHDLIASSLRNVAQLRYYHYDGLGSVRGISDDNGDLQETYDYDAYGTLIGLRRLDAATGQLAAVDLTSSNSEFRTPNSEFLFTGEQFDADLGMYFLRARYLNPDTGRFHTQDTYEGRNGEPLTLHKYLYAHANPVMNTDPSGYMSLSELSVTIGAWTKINVLDNARLMGTASAIGTSLGVIAILADPLQAYGDFKDSVGALGPMAGLAEGIAVTATQRVKALGKFIRFYNNRLTKAERYEEFLKMAPQLRKVLQAGAGRTVALGQMEVDGAIVSMPSVSGRGGNSLGAPLPPTPVFSPFPVPEGTQPRSKDAEYKIMEAFARYLDLGGSKPKKVTLWIDHVDGACSSCQQAISDFSARYSVEVEVIDAR